MQILAMSRNIYCLMKDCEASWNIRKHNREDSDSVNVGSTPAPPAIK